MPIRRYATRGSHFLSCIMDFNAIQAIGKTVFGEVPVSISRKTIGMCNEVYEIAYPTVSYILRMNAHKGFLYGTHKFLPLFKQLAIKTPEIVAEDYSQSDFPFCYQIQTKLEGTDLGWVFDELSSEDLKHIAKDISDIFDKFKSLPRPESFGGMTGANEEHHASLMPGLERQLADIRKRNAITRIQDDEILDLCEQLIRDYTPYFEQVQPVLYYDDICSKNVMIHEGRFNGLVDLDFMSKGDYLEPIGTIVASYYGEPLGKVYYEEIIRRQQLDPTQREVVFVYAIKTLVMYTSEAGIRHNGNSTGEVNWEGVAKSKRKIQGMYAELQELRKS